MKINLHTLDLARLNSATKYPSIPTYHALNPKNGSLMDEIIPFTGSVMLTEKVDGTNARIITTPGNMYIIGSRAELLYGRGDLVANSALGIVDALREIAERVADAHDQDAIVTYYIEVFGGKVTKASREYTGRSAVGFRLFDVAILDTYEEVLAKEEAAISSWRENEGAGWLSEDDLRIEADRHGLELTPRIGEVDLLPNGIEETDAFLKATIPTSQCRLDDEGEGKPEGLVARTHDRSQIAKLRFDDYQRTIKRQAKGG